MSLKDQIVSGVAWSTFARFLQQVAQILFSILLARLLLPQDFGLIGMVLVFSGFAEFFAEFGLRAALVEKRNLEARHLDSVFWLTVIIGLVLTAVLALSAPIIARFYGDPVLQPICQALAVTYLAGSFGIVPRALLQRRMEFAALAKVEITVTLLSGIAALFLAMLGWGVWSLVAQIVSAGFLKSAMVFPISGWRPRFTFDLNAVKELFRYSVNLVGFGVSNYCARHADELLIGKLLGAATLGIYSRAYSLMLLPNSQLINVINDVMFTALSSIKDDKKRVKALYLKANSVITLVAFPMMTGMYVVVDPFIFAVFGARWIEVAPILQILCVVGLLQALYSPTGWLYMSQGRTDWMFWWGIFGNGVLVVGIVVGALFGTAKSIAIGYMAANFLIFYPCIKIPGKLIDMSVREVVRVVGAQLLCSVAMAAFVWVVGQALPSDWSSWALLAIEVPAGILVYGGMIVFFNIAAYRDISQLARELRFRGTKVSAAVDVPYPS